MANVDIRKLKDQAAELLGKSKFDKASDLLEQLTRAEPKEMQHRLKLGDTFRRMGQAEKAINCYQIAGRFFGDEGQLIKAIGAFKVILEIDPKNPGAQRDLAEMNSRRFAKPTAADAAFKAPKAIGAGARAVSELELAEGEKAAAGVSAAFDSGQGQFDMDASGEEPLELDTGRPKQTAGVAARPPSAPGKPGPLDAPQKQAAIPIGKVAPERRGPPPRARATVDLEALNPDAARASPGEAELELPEADLEPLDEDLPAPITAPTPSAQPSGAWRGSPPTGKPAPKLPPAKLPPAASPGRPKVPTHELDLDAADDSIELDPLDFPAAAPRPATAGAKPAPAPVQPKAAEPPRAAAPLFPPPRPPSSAGRPRPISVPIADLLTDPGDDGEEIELVSISSGDELDEEIEGEIEVPEVAAPPASAHPQTPPAATAEDLDAAFDAAVDPAALPAPRARKRPAKVPLFDDLPPDAFLELVNRMGYQHLEAGAVILREGDPGRSFFVIVEGKVRVYKAVPGAGEVTLASLGEGAFFGEMALLSGAPRAANVAAEVETELLEISDMLLREIVGRYPSVANSLKNFYRQRLINNVMATSVIFKDFDPGERKSIVERFKMKQARPGEVLIREGEASDGLYVVLHGSAKVTKKLPDGRAAEVATLREGELAGEMSLLNNEAATATVAAAGPTILLKLPAEQFQELILTHPQILELVSELIDKRRTHLESVLSGHGPGHDGMSFV